MDRAELVAELKRLAALAAQNKETLAIAGILYAVAGSIAVNKEIALIAFLGPFTEQWLRAHGSKGN